MPHKLRNSENVRLFFYVDEYSEPQFHRHVNWVHMVPLLRWWTILLFWSKMIKCYWLNFLSHSTNVISKYTKAEFTLLQRSLNSTKYLQHGTIHFLLSKSNRMLETAVLTNIAIEAKLHFLFFSCKAPSLPRTHRHTPCPQFVVFANVISYWRMTLCNN